MGYKPLEGLRTYQVETVAAVIDAISEGHRRILYTAATSTGKTISFSALTMIFVNEYKWNVLILAHRKELIDQAYQKSRDYCGFYDEIDIDKEMGTNHMNPHASVIVGSVQTCYRETRLKDWKPDVIIIDEAHLSRAKSYKIIMDRFPDAKVIGCTATAKRLDKQALYASSAIEPARGVKYQEEDGVYYLITKDAKTKKERRLLPEEAVYEKLVFEYTMLQGVEDGYLVEPEQVIVKSAIDLSEIDVRMGKDGDVDFVDSQLQRKLEETKALMIYRINLAYQAWLQCASDRPTVIFAPSVNYARETAAFWHSKGHTAQAIDATSETNQENKDTPWIPCGIGARQKAIDDIRSRKVQVTVNVGLYTAGTDIDIWSCAVLLRPTSSWALYNQMAGRVGRPLGHVAKMLGKIGTAEERKALIASSDKPNAIIIDVVDLCKSHSLCTMPAIMDLPCEFDLQGGSVSAAAKMLDEYKDVSAQVLGECPMTLQDLQVRLEYVRLVRNSGARSRDAWIVSPDGSYTNGHTPPGYVGKLEKDGEKWKLSVVDCESGEIVYQKQAERRKGKIEDYFDSADAAVQKKVEEHRKAKPPKSTGMYQKVLNAQRAAEAIGKRDPRLFYLGQAGFDKAGIDALHDIQVRAIVKKERAKYWEEKNGVQQASA